MSGNLKDQITETKALGSPKYLECKGMSQKFCSYCSPSKIKNKKYVYIESMYIIHILYIFAYIYICIYEFFNEKGLSIQHYLVKIVNKILTILDSNN